MATIKYNGMELEEYRPDNPETYEPPKKMLVWSEDLKDFAVLAKVLYVNPRYSFVSVLQDNGHIAVFDHCALIPETPASRMATWFELAKWLATGNGIVLDSQTERIDTGVMFKVNNLNDPVDDKIKVCKWDDPEWHDPTVEYMNITEEAELTRLKARIAELERMDTEHTLQIAKMNGYIHHLEEERRWRKCCEGLPSKGQRVLFLAKYKTGYIRTWIGEFRNVDFDVFYASAPGCGCEFLPNEIFGWMPLPSAPKEEK